jgi:hypothetical protein
MEVVAAVVVRGRARSSSGETLGRVRHLHALDAGVTLPHCLEGV